MIKVGDTIFVEEAWEDVAGYYHDEPATVLSIVKGEMTLDFYAASEEVREFLSKTDGYMVSDYEEIGEKPC